MQLKFTEKALKSLQVNSKPYEVVDLALPGFRLRVQPTGVKTFVYCYKDRTGTKERYTIGRFGVLTLSQAREKATVLAGQVADGRSPQQEKRESVQKAKTEQGLTLQSFVDKHYKPWVLKNMKSGENTLKLLERHFSEFVDKPMAKISPTQLEKWQLKEMDRDIKPVTINRNLAALRSVFSKALSLHLIDSNPLKSIKNITEIKEDYNRYLDSAEMSRLMAALADRDGELREKRSRGNQWRKDRGYNLRVQIGGEEYPDHISPMVLLAMYTGLRKGEIFRLEWSDVDFDGNLITVRGVNAKSKRVRRVPMHPKVQRMLESWHRQRQTQYALVFPNRNGNRFKDIKKAWYSLLERAQISNFRFHDLRHHFASHLVMKGTPINTVRELLGHADIGTTLRYAHLADEHKSDAILALD
ncbi:site-specific integrase [Pseudomaricurvus alkylphenolicus]|uniref:site-specific integrase n=1 Tax=Pseudomaricurvus alkylphenolicus TaxID=1306991 RepID=UPI00141E120F|nr:site-specific integrase [Pseudomaricurvus alkylphenolicus]NIB43098.1 site-specific integrase [Pseudomaricurvus alkylphenolicus]